MWVKLNNRKRGQFECNVTYFCFCIDFVCSHARYHLESGVCLKLDVQGQGNGKILDTDGQAVEVLENWTIFMDVTCVL